MDTELLINNSDDDTGSLNESDEFKDQLSQPLRGPSLEDVVDLGVSIRDESEGNAYSGIDFRDVESLSTNLRLDNFKENDCPVGNTRESHSTDLKAVGSSSFMKNEDTVLKSPGRTAFSSQRKRSHQHTEDEVLSNLVASLTGCEEPSSSLESLDESYLNNIPVKPNTGIASLLSEGKKYHVFFSYEISDRDWVKEMTKRLESPEFGFRCSIHERDFHGGKRIIENITEHLRVSEKTVLVLSPDFIQSHWCRFEIELGMVLSMEESQLLLVPVMVRQCDVPDSIKTLTYIDATPGNDWWHRFMDALTTKDSLEADFPGTRDLTIRPRFGNMDFLTEFSSSFKCLSGEAIRTPYVPDVLMRPGIEISAEDFDENIDNIRSSSRFFCTCLSDITGICVPLFVVLLAFGVIIMPILFYSFNMPGTGEMNSLAPLLFLMECPWILMIICFFIKRWLRKSRLQRAVNEANKAFLKNNVILGFRVETSACIMFTIKLVFWYYNMSECQTHLKDFLQTSERLTVNANCHEIAQAHANKLIFRHSAEYTRAYTDGKLRPKHGLRHVRHASCLCQFIEKKYSDKTKTPRTDTNLVF